MSVSKSSAISAANRSAFHDEAVKSVAARIVFMVDSIMPQGASLKMPHH